MALGRGDVDELTGEATFVRFLTRVEAFSGAREKQRARLFDKSKGNSGYIDTLQRLRNCSIVIQVRRRTEVKGCRSSTSPSLPGYQGTVHLKLSYETGEINK